MSSEDERVAWLRATIEGDRALAKRVAARYVAGPGSSREGEAIWPTTVIERAWQEYEDPDVRAGLDFIRAHDPQDVIADCEAKLRLLDEHRIVFADDEDYSVDRHGAGHGCAICHYYARMHVKGSGICLTLRVLATGYRHRDGFAAYWEKSA